MQEKAKNEESWVLSADTAETYEGKVTPMKYTEKAIRSIRPNDTAAYSDVQYIITVHALGASLASVASGWIPGIGEGIATGIATGFVCTMYYRLAKRMDLNLPRNALKGIASAIIAEIAVYIAAVLFLAAAITFIPGIGTLSGALLSGTIAFCMVQSAGELFLTMMSKLFRAKTSAEIEEMSVDELKAFAKGCSTRKMVKECVKEARTDYIHVRNDPNLQAASTAISPEEELHG